MKSIYYEETDCKVYWDTENDWMYVDWRNQPSEETAKKGGEEMLKLLKEKSCSKVLNDNSNVSGSWSVASQWTAEVWFPMMIEAGLKKFAWVLSPHSILSRKNAQESDPNEESQIIKMFDTTGEATQWLKTD